MNSHSLNLQIKKKIKESNQLAFGLVLDDNGCQGGHCHHSFQRMAIQNRLSRKKVRYSASSC